MAERSSILESISLRRRSKRTQRPAEAGEVNSDLELFRRFLAGDDVAFMELFDRHTHRLYMYCLKFVNDRRQAEDLVQDLWERLIKLRKDRRESAEQLENPVGFLVRMARNLCLNQIRGNRNMASLDDLADWEHPAASHREMSHAEELVVAALEHLPPSQREVLVLNAYSGYRFDEIATMLGEQVGAVRTRAWRARMQLGRIISAFIGLDDSNDEQEDRNNGTALWEIEE
ncbi:MAG: RNA polymerase sigma factor [Bacteroidetes bacterium]|nr:RNA polymerase sigma factor [Bacteroidota bacterium]